MQEYEVLFRSEAQDEAVEAAGYIAEHSSLEIALAWYEGLELALTSLVDMPYRFPLARENDAFPDTELRQLHYQSYRVIFTVLGSEVHVLHVRHTARPGLEGD